MRVLVTGAQGFAGAHLVSALGAAGHEAVACGSPRSPGGLDVRDAAAVRRAVARAAPDAVVHLAAITHLPKVLAEPDLALDVNVSGTLHVLEAVLREAPRARVLVISSGVVYGSPPPGALPLDEGAPLLSEHPYGVQKIAAECLAQRYRDDAGLDALIVRPFNHLGPGQGTRFAASWFAAQIARAECALGGANLRVGNLEPKRDLLDVRDVVRAYVLLLDRDVPAGIYNVARGASTRIGWILDWFVARARVPVAVESDASLFRPLDAPDLVGSHERLRAATGWEPRIPIEETLSAVLDDARAEAAREAAAGMS